MEKQQVPQIGNEYHFFDDGKIRDSRHYIGIVKEILTEEEAKNKKLRTYLNDEDVIKGMYCEYDEAFETFYAEMSLSEIRKRAYKDHLNTDDFTVIRGEDTSAGSSWLYAKETDYYIGVSIPVYDENIIWFVRDIRGGWFSMDIQCCWQCGRLDVDGKLYERMMSY